MKVFLSFIAFLISFSPLLGNFHPFFSFHVPIFSVIQIYYGDARCCSAVHMLGPEGSEGLEKMCANRVAISDNPIAHSMTN